MNDVNEFSRFIGSQIDNKTSQIFTSLPGTILSYDGVRAKSTVKAAVTFHLPDERTLDFPVIENVIVVFPCGSGGNASVTFPIKAGDGCLLVFASQSIDGWLLGGRESTDPRKHDIKDCFAVPGIYINGVAGYNAHPEDVVLHNEGAILRVTPGGPIYCNVDLVVDGEIRSTGDQIAGSISQKEHVHGGVQSGGSQTTEPVGGE